MGIQSTPKNREQKRLVTEKCLMQRHKLCECSYSEICVNASQSVSTEMMPKFQWCRCFWFHKPCKCQHLNTALHNHIQMTLDQRGNVSLLQTRLITCQIIPVSQKKLKMNQKIQTPAVQNVQLLHHLGKGRNWMYHTGSRESRVRCAAWKRWKTREGLYVKVMLKHRLELEQHSNQIPNDKWCKTKVFMSQ